MSDAELLTFCLGSLDAAASKTRNVNRKFVAGASRVSLRGTTEDIRKKLVDTLDVGTALIAKYLNRQTGLYKEKRLQVIRTYLLWKWGRGELRDLEVALTDVLFTLDLLRPAVGLNPRTDKQSQGQVFSPAAAKTESADDEDAERKVFIVHGHDETSTLKLQRFLRDDLKLSPIVLRYEAGKGRTLIEKFEQIAQHVSYAFALLCPDDQVSYPDGTYAQARPNVVFELGWFCRRLTRSGVCILLKKGTKLHSDLDGISRIEFEGDIEGKFIEVRRELEGAGLLPH